MIVMTHHGSRLEDIYSDLSGKVSGLRFASPVTHVYNPLDYAWNPVCQYLDLAERFPGADRYPGFTSFLAARMAAYYGYHMTGIVDPAESCDDGNTAGGDGCRADCTLEICGDGKVDEAGLEGRTRRLQRLGRGQRREVGPADGAVAVVGDAPVIDGRAIGEDAHRDDEVDRVLDKISESGMDSLTPDERRLLDDVSKRLLEQFGMPFRRKDEEN